MGWLVGLDCLTIYLLRRYIISLIWVYKIWWKWSRRKRMRRRWGRIDGIERAYRQNGGLIGNRIDGGGIETEEWMTGVIVRVGAGVHARKTCMPVNEIGKQTFQGSYANDHLRWYELLESKILIVIGYLIGLKFKNSVHFYRGNIWRFMASRLLLYYSTVHRWPPPCIRGNFEND